VIREEGGFAEIRENEIKGTCFHVKTGEWRTNSLGSGAVLGVKKSSQNANFGSCGGRSRGSGVQTADG
jgi:hypothetical protein